MIAKFNEGDKVYHPTHTFDEEVNGEAVSMLYLLEKTLTLFHVPRDWWPETAV